MFTQPAKLKRNFLYLRVVGFDFIPSAEVMKKLYSKLIESYAFDAYISARPSHRSTKKKVHPTPEASNQKAAEFLERIKTLPSRRFPSPGHGWDYRFLGDNLVG